MKYSSHVDQLKKLQLIVKSQDAGNFRVEKLIK